VLGAVELALFIWALVDLARRPRTSLLPRWAWLVIIILFELLGSILYLALGRGESTVATSPPAGGIGSAELDESRSQRAVDMLYGPGDATRPPDRAPSGDPQSKPSQSASPPRGEAPRNAASPSANDDPDAGRGPGGG
jgi:Phospholipase_D-nuclease N-terminal